MLLPSFFETEPLEIMRLINTTQNYAVWEIAKRILAMEKLRDELELDDYVTITSSNQYRMERLNQIRLFDIDFRAELASLTKKAIAEIDILFEKAATEAHNFDRSTFTESLNKFIADEKISRLTKDEIQQRAFDKGLKPFVEYKDNKYLQHITKSIADQTKDAFTNITQTVGFTNSNGQFMPHREYFTQKLNEVSFQVATGVTGYNEAIKRTVREMVDSGLRSVEYPYAKAWRVETSVRTNILTGISQLASQVSWKNAEDLGCEFVETSMHMGARKSHQAWQGRRFALNGSVAEIRTKAEEIRESYKGKRAMREAEKAIEKKEKEKK